MRMHEGIRELRRDATARPALAAGLAVLLALAGGTAGAFPGPEALRLTARAPFTAAHTAAIAAESAAAAREVMERGVTTAIAVAVADEGGIVWLGNYGTRDRRGGEAVGPDTMFGLCSVSKTYVAACVMKLADRGAVDLDAPVTRYVPEFVMEDPRYRSITVRMLLNHSAGLPGIDMQGAMTTDRPFPGYADKVVRNLSLQRLKHEPGGAAIYANDGFTVLEILIRNVSGLDYPEFARRELFLPLGMRDSQFMDRGPLAPGTYAVPEEFKDSPLPFHNVFGSGGLFSSAADMARFGRIFLTVGGSGGFLSGKALASMGEDRSASWFNPMPSEDFRFGLGWDTVSQPGMRSAGIRAWQKGGDLGYYGSNLLVMPEEGLVVAVLGASGFSSGQAVRIAERVALRALAERGRIPRMPEPLPPRAAKASPPDIGERAGITGYYARSPFTLYRAVFAENGNLTLETKAGGTWKPLYAGYTKRADGWYSGEDSVKSLRFMGVEGRSFIGLGRPGGAGHYRSEILLAERMPSGGFLHELWKARLGIPWLLATEITEAEDVDAGVNPVIVPEEVPEVPGYIRADALDGGQAMKAVDATRAVMWMLLPEISGRDLRDLVAETIGGVEYLRFGAELYRRASSVPALQAGTSDAKPDSPGLGVWRKLPSSGFVSIRDASRWRIYDASFDAVASGPGDGAARWSVGDGAWLVVYPSDPSGAKLELED